MPFNALRLTLRSHLYCTVLAVCGLLSADIAYAEPPAQPMSNKKILWIDSYHQGYPWSDGAEAGLRKTLAGTGISIDVIRMDAKHKLDSASLQAAGIAVVKQIEKSRPDLIVASDDPAQAYAVVPYLLDKSIPIVFTGLNRSATLYGYPRPGVTGMIEVSQPQTLVKHLKTLGKGDRIAVLGSDDISETNSIAYLRNQNDLFREDTAFVLVKTYKEFQRKFVQLQVGRDALVLLNVTTLPGWDAKTSPAWIMKHTRIPTGTVNEWMANLALVTVGKVAEEQGEFAGKAAIRILQGTKPEAISIATNQQASLVLNHPLAKALGIVFPVSMLRASVTPAL